MFKLRQRLKKYFFLFPSIREVMAIVRRKNPYFDGKVTVSIEQYHSFDSAQNARISSSCGFQSNNITLREVFIIVL